MRAIIASIVLIYSSVVYSCDVCGGLSSNPNIGLFAASTSFHQTGMRLNYRSYDTYLYGIEHSSERILNGELFGRFQVSRRFQLLATIPYQFAQQRTDLSTTVLSGMGDPSMIGNWIVLEKIDSTMVTKHFLSFGGGASLPLGKHTHPDDELKNIYPGSGAMNYLFLGTYVHQFTAQWGLQSEVSYMIKGKDSYTYRFGNSFSVQAQMLNRKRFKNRLLISTAGLQLEDQAASERDGLAIPDNPNNARILSLRVGSNLLVSSWLFSLNFQQPLIQRINNGTVRNRGMATIGISYFIQKNKKK